MYCYRGNHDMAISTLRKGLKVERRSTKLLYCLGWAFQLKDDIPAAIECLQSVIEVDSGYVNAYNRLGDIHFQRAEYNQALAQYRKAIRIAPDLSEAHRLMGRTYAAMDQYGKAISAYTNRNKSE